MQASRTPVLGLVGYSMAGRLFHRPQIHRAGLRIGTVATRNPERAAQARADLPEAVLVPDLAALLDTGPDAVVLATPTGVHAEQALACIEAGVPVIVDKPLAVDAAQAQAVVAAADRAAGRLTVFQNRRWDRDQVTLRALLEAGELGEIYRAERRYERYRPHGRGGWREELPADRGGGLLLDLGVHLIDQAVQLFGPVGSVYGELTARHRVAEDDVFLSLLHRGGVRSHLSVTSLAAAPGPAARILGSRGGYLFGNQPEDLPAFTAPADEPGHTGWLVRGDQATPVPTAAGEQADFYRLVPAWLAGGPPPVDAHDVVHTLQVMDAARLSAREGIVARVQPPPTRIG